MGCCCGSTSTTTTSEMHRLERKEPTAMNAPMLDYLDEDENQDTTEYERIDDASLQPLLVSQKSVYRAVKGDDVDAAIEKIFNNLNYQLPVIRISAGKYLIGTGSSLVSIKGNSCMVRVGGGWEKLETFIARNAESEMEKIKKIMNDQGKTYNQVVLDLLAKYGADNTVINGVSKSFRLQIANAKKQLAQQKEQEKEKQDEQ